MSLASVCLSRLFNQIATTRYLASIRWLSALLIPLTLGACAMLPKAESQAEPPAVYVWPMAQCPSMPAPKTFAEQHSGTGEAQYLGPLPLGIGGVAVTEITSALFGVPSQLLAQAAKADVGGFSASSTNARFYYSNVTDATDPAQNGKYRLVPPGCYVVALYKTTPKPQEDPSSWCDNANFKKALKSACDLSRAPPVLFTSGPCLPLKVRNSKPVDPADPFADTTAFKEPVLPLDCLPLVPMNGGRANETYGLRSRDLLAPDFYVEIYFEEVAQVVGSAKPPKPAASSASATDSATSAAAAPDPVAPVSIVIPRAYAVYYPDSLLERGSNKKRALSIAIAMSQVASYKSATAGTGANVGVAPNKAEEGGLLNANFTLVLDASKPGQADYNSLTTVVPQPWAIVPALNASLDIPIARDENPDIYELNRVPVNITATVHEANDPSIFLAALAQATQSAGAGLRQGRFRRRASSSGGAERASNRAEEPSRSQRT